MRAFLSLALLSAMALPGSALAQDVSPSLALPGPATTVAPVDVTAAPTLAPLQTVQPTVEAPPPVSAKPAPAPVTDAADPTLPNGPTKVAPVITPKDGKGGVGGTVGTIAGGVAGGAAGAAVAGPVGKFAGSFLGKTIARGIFGKDKTPEVTVAEVPPSAETAAAPAVAAPATAPPLKEKVSTSPSDR